jgi:hypothetical protein
MITELVLIDVRNEDIDLYTDLRSTSLHFVIPSYVGEVRSTARHALHFQFDIIANALEIRLVKSPKCIV